MEKEQTFEFKINSDLKYLPYLRKMVSEIARDCSNDEKFVNKCAVVLTEAVDNAVIHAHKKIKSKPIRVVIKRNTKDVSIEVWDSGEGFEISEDPNWPDLMSTSGRGVEIIRSLSSEVSYKRSGKNNRLRIVVQK